MTPNINIDIMNNLMGKQHIIRDNPTFDKINLIDGNDIGENVRQSRSNNFINKFIKGSTQIDRPKIIPGIRILTIGD